MLGAGATVTYVGQGSAEPGLGSYQPWDGLRTRVSEPLQKMVLVVRWYTTKI